MDEACRAWQVGKQAGKQLAVLSQQWDGDPCPSHLRAGILADACQQKGQLTFLTFVLPGVFTSADAFVLLFRESMTQFTFVV